MKIPTKLFWKNINICCWDTLPSLYTHAYPKRIYIEKVNRAKSYWCMYTFTYLLWPRDLSALLDKAQQSFSGSKTGEHIKN